MAIINFPYETTLCRAIKTDKVINELKRAEIENPLPKPKIGLNKVADNVRILVPASEYEDIPAFTQCISLSSDYIVFDARPFLGGQIPGSVDYVIRSSNDYQFQVIRAIFTSAFVSGDRATFTSRQKFAWRAFDRMVTNAIVTQANLRFDVAVQLKLSIISAIYIISMFNESSDSVLYNEPELTAINVARMVGVKRDDVVFVMNQLKPMNTIRDFCENIATATGSLRLQKFNFTVLFNYIGSYWYGYKSRETIGVALEHMPTLFAMIYCGLNDRSFRKMRFVERLDSIQDNRAKQDFIHEFKGLINEYLS